MKIPERIVWGVENSVEMLRRHPLLAWNLIRNRDGLKYLLEIISGENMYFHTTGDEWKEFRKHLKNKICHRFTK